MLICLEKYWAFYCVQVFGQQGLLLGPAMAIYFVPCCLTECQSLNYIESQLAYLWDLMFRHNRETMTHLYFGFY